MAGIKTYRATLQDVVDPDDALWTYTVPNLPSTQHTNAGGLIKFVSVVSSSSKQHIGLRYDAPPPNRVTRGEMYNKMVLISFADFRLQWPTATVGDKPRPATMKENGDYITRMLTTGLRINGQQYHFFGHSNSQLKTRSCFLYAGSKGDISKKIEAMGGFSKLKSVDKKAKRIGLLFSSAEMALDLSPDRCEDIDDVQFNDYIFTDGCGLISQQLAAQLCRNRNIVYRGLRYHPSVFQIRYRGYKGVLTVDPTLQRQIQVQFRESMRKFKDASDLSFSVVDYSKPYSFGHPNDEVIILLHALGISQDVLLSKQKQHLEWLQSVSQGDVRAAFQFFSFINRMDLTEKLLFKGFEAISSTAQGLVRQEYTRMLNKRDEQRCRILIPKSRLVFGVCDPHSKQGRVGKLKEGECFVRITTDGDGKPRTIINTEVLVTRNPCLHPGDLQKLKAVDVPELSHLADCIVFSTQGKRPSADLMSGGDLDGDKFFVTWDPDIIPRTVSEPAAYPGVKEPPSFKSISDDGRAEYFARYANASLGRVKNLYLKWARLGNAMSPQCQQLNRLFSQCVDGNRIKVPQDLEDPPEADTSAPPFILDVLHTASTEIIEHATNRRYTFDGSQDAEFIVLLLSRDKLAISEFELFQLALQWCRRHSYDVMKFAQLFDFSALSDEQQLWILSSLPPSADAPSLIRNGLLQSELVTAEELHRFGLDHARLHWKPVFSSSKDRMGRFNSTVCRSLELFHKKLVVLSVDERLTLAIYLPSKIPRATEVQVDSNVRVFALPRSQGVQSPSYKVKPTKVDYRLYCDESALQLYEKKRANTWIYLNRSQFNESSYRNVISKGDRRRQKEHSVEDGTNFDCRVRVALQKISGDIQRHLGRLNRAGVLGAEVYVISNRDIQSMRFLDQWLEYINTDEVLPLFERMDIDYKVPTLDAITWDLYSPSVAAVARDRNLSHLRRVDSPTDLQTILDLLVAHEEKMLLRDVFLELLSLEASNSCLVSRQHLVLTLLNLLPSATYLLPMFLQSQSWKSHKTKLEYDLVRLGPILLSSLILAANELQGFIRQPLMHLLQELRQITLQNFAELVELVALSVRSPEIALDLLLEILEPETSRLLVGRPLAVRQFVRCLFGIALDHVDEASNNKKAEKEALRLCLDDRKDEYTIVNCSLRIDSNMGGILKVGDHVRLTVSNPPQNAPLKRPVSLDALVLKADAGTASFRCLHPPPTYVEDCSWNISLCGSFVTSKTMIDAVTNFYIQREVCCLIYALVAGLSDRDQIDLPGVDLPVAPDSSLNESQNSALEAAMKHSLTFIWGPPGTGKTHTVVVILTQLLEALPKSRFLVTAPTHNAVDNLLRRFITDGGKEKSGVRPLRVATQVSHHCA
ncbi:RdRP-domain-containing protein [Lophiostoma macrostomum CBS 122681]|uniref:RNA-dependent RNA polymerase n=1 Tax=Lophiostoma macrostomum CBS 122681 TaxID=1314788 RepID=A0A6A6T417_9PLEO|nr:RdRP-domain-containing protein [Lophiostoma macrostomum CBS 122681]